MATRHAGETTIPGIDIAQLKRNCDEAVEESAIGIPIVALTPIRWPNKVRWPTGALTTAMKLELARILRIDDVDIVVIKTVVLAEKHIQVGRDSGKVNQVDVCTTPLEHGR